MKTLQTQKLKNKIENLKNNRIAKTRNMQYYQQKINQQIQIQKLEQLYQELQQNKKITITGGI